MEDIEKFIKNNYKGNNKNYIQDIQNAKGLFSNNEHEALKSIMTVNCSIQENAFKRTGVTMNFCNRIQMNMIRSIQENQINFNNSNPVGVTTNLNSNNRNMLKRKENYNLIPNNFAKNINENNLGNNGKGPIGPKLGSNISIDKLGKKDEADN